MSSAPSSAAPPLPLLDVSRNGGCHELPVDLVVEDVVDAGNAAHELLDRQAERGQSAHRGGEARHQRLECDEAADRDLAVHDPEAAEDQDQRVGDAADERRQDAEIHRGPRDLLLGVDNLRLLAGQLVEVVVVGAVGFQRLDAGQPPDGHSHQLARLGFEATVGVGHGARDEPQHAQADREAGNTDQGERHVVEKEKRAKENHRNGIDDHPGELMRDDARELFVEIHPRCQVTDITLAEELDRQTQQVPHETAGFRDADPEVEADKVVALQPGQPGPDQCRDKHAQDQRSDPAVEPADEIVVDENASKYRQGETGQDQRHPTQGNEGDRRLAASDPRSDAVEKMWRRAATAEFWPRLEDEGNTREALVELAPGDRPRPCGGVIEIDLAAAKPLDNKEMVHVPVDDQRS